MKIEFKDISHGENEKGRTFDHHCVLEVKTEDDGGNAVETKEQGYMIQGKDCIFLNAAKIYPPQDPDLLPDGQYTPLLTEHQDIVGAINELFQCGSGGGDVFQVGGSGSGITVTTVKNRGKAQELTTEFFTFKTKEFKTMTTVTSGNTTVTKMWSKTVITEVLKDETVWKFSLDSSGDVTAAFDSVGNDVLNGVTGADGNSVITPTPEGIALGWALAYNNEQDSALKKALDAYQDGIDDCDEINEKEGVDCGCGDCGNGEGGGDGTGGDGTGDGTGGKIPEKNFQEYKGLPLNDDGSIPIPAGSGAYWYRGRYNSGKLTNRDVCDVIVVDMRNSDNIGIGMFTNDGRSVAMELLKDDGTWFQYGTLTGQSFFGGYHLINGKFVNYSGHPNDSTWWNVAELQGDVYYVY